MSRNTTYILIFIGIACICIIHTTRKAYTAAQRRPTVYLFSHALQGNHRQARFYSGAVKNAPYSLCPGPVFAFDYPDVSRVWWRMNTCKVNLGQDVDVQSLKCAYERCITQYPDHDVVIIGVCRGAVAAFNFCALYHPKHVKMLIIESPWDDLKKVIDFHLSRYYITKLGRWTISTSNFLLKALFWDYNPNGISPRSVAHLIDRNLPIVIVGIPHDDTVPYSCQERLYHQLHALECTDVHLLKLSDGYHGALILDGDKKRYARTVHQLYKDRGLTYDPVLIM